MTRIFWFFKIRITLYSGHMQPAFCYLLSAVEQMQLQQDRSDASCFIKTYLLTTESSQEGLDGSLLWWFNVFWRKTQTCAVFLEAYALRFYLTYGCLEGRVVLKAQTTLFLVRAFTHHNPSLSLTESVFPLGKVSPQAEPTSSGHECNAGFIDLLGCAFETCVC